MILVTGGTGLLGGHLLLELLKGDEPVRAIIREGSDPKKVYKIFNHYSDNTQGLYNRIEWFPADILNKASVKDAFGGITKVYHCAALVSFDNRVKSEMFETNLTGTENIVNTCLENNIKKLIHVSSIATIGKSLNESAVSETDGWPVKFSSVYAQTKTLAEMEVWRGISEGLEAVIVNPSVIIGPGHWEKGSSSIFSLVANNLRYYTIGGTGFVDARDVAEIMVQLMKSNITGERFILNAENVLYEILLEAIATQMNIKGPTKLATPIITSMAWRAGAILNFLSRKPKLPSKQEAKLSHAVQKYSAAKLEKALNFNFRPVHESIEDITKFFIKDHPAIR